MTPPLTAPAEALRKRLAEAARIVTAAVMDAITDRDESFADRVRKRDAAINQAVAALTPLLAQAPAPAVPEGPFPLGTRVEKRSGSSWHGHIVGYYRTALTTDGVCVESEREPGSVQIYPARALQAAPVPPKPETPHA